MTGDDHLTSSIPIPRREIFKIMAPKKRFTLLWTNFFPSNCMSLSPFSLIMQYLILFTSNSKYLLQKKMSDFEPFVTPNSHSYCSLWVLQLWHWSFQGSEGNTGKLWSMHRYLNTGQLDAVYPCLTSHGGRFIYLFKYLNPTFPMN